MEFRRLILLLHQLRDEYVEEHGRERGAPIEIARRTGLSLSYVRKYLSGERGGISVKTLESVRRRLRLSSRYFSDASLGDTPHYRDFVGLPDDAVPEPFAVFRDTYPRFGELTERQVTQLLEMEFRGGRPSTPHVYRAVADWMLDGGASPSPRSTEAAERAEREGVRRVGTKYRKKRQT